MPLRHATNHDDEELVRYLLGLVPDEIREELDEASVADDEFAARLRTAETNLIDSYVRGRLAGATLDRFESYYLASPLRRTNVRQAARFLGAVDRSAAREEAVSWTQRFARPIRLAPLAAVAALMVVVSGVFLFRTMQPQKEPSLAASLDPSPQRTREAPLRSADSDASVPSTPAATAERRAAPADRIVAMVLLPPTRSVAPAPTLALPSGADRVRFELQLESNDFPSYRVGVKNPATNQILWRSEWIAPISPAEGAVAVLVPANLLQPLHYSLDLAGRDRAGREEVIGSYIVRIVEP